MSFKALYFLTTKTEVLYYNAVASGAGPRAVGTERGRWSKW